MRVVALASEPNAAPAALVDVVQRDAGLVAAILSQANAATHRRAGLIASVPQALARLGLTRVSEIALSTSLRASLLTAPRYRASIKQTWRLSLAAGLFAKEISIALSRNVELAFVSGMLRSAGCSLVLYSLAAWEGSEAIDESRALGLAAEFSGPFAAAATRRWGLPQVVTRAVCDGDPAEERPQEASIAALAQRLAYFALRGGEELPIDCREAGELDLYPESIAALVRRSSDIRAAVDRGP